MDDTLDKLLQEALDTRSEEALKALERHLIRSGYSSKRTPSSYYDAVEMIQCATSYIEEGAWDLTQRLSRLLEGVAGLKWTIPTVELQDRGSTAPEFSFQLKIASGRPGLSHIHHAICGRDPMAVTDEQLVAEVRKAAELFHVDLTNWHPNLQEDGS